MSSAIFSFWTHRSTLLSILSSFSRFQDPVCESYRICVIYFTLLETTCWHAENDTDYW